MFLALCAGAILLPAAPGVAHAAPQSRTYAGRPLGEVLDQMRAQGITFIYNTRIVPPQLRIGREPRARSGIALATEILADHGLHVSQAAPGVYAIVPDAPNVSRRAVEPPVPQADALTLEEVVVHTSRYRLTADSAASQAVLTQEDVKSMPRLGDETLRAVQRLPGVATAGFSSLGAVRGGEPNETAIVLDGLRLYEPFHLKNFLSPISLLDSRVIETMDVYSGGFPVIHGDRMSSIIDADSVQPAQARYYEAGLSLFHANLLASSTFDDDRGRGLISARRSNVGDLASYSEKDFGEPQYFDAFAKVDYRFTDDTRASFHALASSDRISAVKDSGRERSNAEYRNIYAWGVLARDWSEASDTRMVLSYTDVNNEREGTIDDPGKRTAQVSDLRDFHVIGLRADHRFPLFGVEQRVGFEVRRLWGGYDYQSDVRFEADFPFPGSPVFELQRTAAPRPDGFESAAWWDMRLLPGSRWTVLGGMRFDTQTYDGSGDAGQFAPRLNLLYDLSKSTQLRVSAGRFFQAQGINELQVEDGVGRFYQAQHADHLILSMDHRLGPGWDLRVEAYRKYYRRINPRYENLINPLGLLPEAQFDRVRIEPDSARAEGVEVMMRWQSQGAWRAWLAYAWSQALDRIDGRAVARSWDQTHAVNLGVNWASGPWAASAVNTFHTGWPTTKLYMSGNPGGAQQLVIGERNAQRVDYYNSLDLRLTRTFVLPRGALDVFVEVSNALSRENPCCADYSIARGADGSVVLNEGTDAWLPMVPSIGVLWRY